MKDWRFISNQNSMIVGINDAGIETFTANMNRSLIREMIQNSLDAVIPDSNGKVVVDFACFDMPIDKIPAVDKLKDAMTKCKSSNSNEPDAFKFFDDAEKILEQSTVKVLRISDHNTVGLEGSDTCEKGTNWSRLVKESGSSNKGQSSGGSFGIGKSAAFACSDLRTVFYSSIDHYGLKSNFGVARLVSFQDDEIGGWTTGVGYYSEDEKFVAIPELARFDRDYVRSDSGTDIYIIGMHMTDDFVKTFVQAVLLDFLVALIQEKLVVNIQDKVIDKQSLHTYMSQLNQYDSEEIKDLYEYYYLLTSADPTIKKIPLGSIVYGSKYGFEDGECTLYLRESEGLNRKILITRKAGMRILEQNRISGSIEFTGVLIISGSNMNEAFKKMEVPSHDAWEPGRCRGEEKYYSDILSNLKRYLKNVVKECFGRASSDSMDAIGANDFLPDKRVDEMHEKTRENGLCVQIKDLHEKSVEPTKKRTPVIEDIKIDPEQDGKGSGGWKDGEGHIIHPDPHQGQGPGADQGEEGDKQGDKTSYKEIRVKKRLICSDEAKGVYILSFIVPKTAGKGKLEFVLAGEQSDFKLPIVSAGVISKGYNTVVEFIRENIVYLSDLTKGEQLKLEVVIEFDTYCMMEVEYYADKR